MDQEHEEQAGHRGDLLQNFWCKPKTNGAAFWNTVDDNPLNVIKRAFESLSEEEQNKIRRNQFGDEEPVDESSSPTFVDEKLEELEKEINLLSDNIKRAYEEAIEQEQKQSAVAAAASAAEAEGVNHLSKQGKDQQDDKEKKDENDTTVPPHVADYVRSKSFRLMFLRAENFNARVAARRITRYFKEKRDLFGIDKLASKIKQSDLSEAEKEFLHSGYLCSTGGVDIHGRLIIFVCRSKFTDDIPPGSLKRAAFYFYQIIEDYEDSQRKGVVCVLDGRGMVLPTSVASFRQQRRQQQRLYPIHRMAFYALPLRCACIHLCYDSEEFLFFLKLALLIVPNKLRPIVNSHYNGNKNESSGMQETSSVLLEEYGIVLEALPLTAEWELCGEAVEKFINSRREKEEAG